MGKGGKEREKGRARAAMIERDPGRVALVASLHSQWSVWGFNKTLCGYRLRLHSTEARVASDSGSTREVFELD